MGVDAITRTVRRAVFLDRDGVLNLPIMRGGKPHPPQSLEEFVILPNVSESLLKLREGGFYLYVVTNQPDVSRGTQARETIEAMHAILSKALLVHGIYVCYHDDSDKCECRKPLPGMLLKAAAKHDLCLENSYLVGDRWRDIDCGHAAKCTTILIDRGYNEVLRKRPHFRVPDLRAATTIILSH